MKPFDKELYGAFVRLLRRKRGEDAEDFANVLVRECEMYVTKDRLAAIECGIAEPSIGEFMAINAVLFGNEYSPRAFALGAGDMDFRMEVA